jgi:hypothetical protein
MDGDLLWKAFESPFSGSWAPRCGAWPTNFSFIQQRRWSKRELYFRLMSNSFVTSSLGAFGAVSSFYWISGPSSRETSRIFTVLLGPGFAIVTLHPASGLCISMRSASHRVPPPRSRRNGPCRRGRSSNGLPRIEPGLTVLPALGVDRKLCPRGPRCQPLDRRVSCSHILHLSLSSSRHGLRPGCVGKKARSRLGDHMKGYSFLEVTLRCP